MVKEQLCQLTLKNRGMKANMQEMRENVVGELMSIMKTRRIVLEQLGRAGLEESMRRDCKELLVKRRDHMTTKEEELISLEKLLSGHEAVLEHADSACLELEEKIRAYERDRIWDNSYTLRGMVYRFLSWSFTDYAVRFASDVSPCENYGRWKDFRQSNSFIGSTITRYRHYIAIVHGFYGSANGATVNDMEILSPGWTCNHS